MTVDHGGALVGCINLIFGAVLPRLALWAAWSNDAVYWNALFGSQLWLGLGFIALPWTTLIYGFVSPNGLSLLNIIFIVLAFVGDLGTWGMGFFGGRKEVSNYRGT
jgi:glucose dehydrogenase